MSPDGLELTRYHWAKEKAAGHWEEAYLASERTARRTWIEEQRREREQKAREKFLKEAAPAK